MLAPLGSFIPDAVFEDIGLFFDHDHLHRFSIASPRANVVFKNYRMIAYRKVKIDVVANKLFVELQESNIENNSHKKQIYISKEDMIEKLSILLSTCRSIDELICYGCSEDNSKWKYVINQQILELMLNIKIKNAYLQSCMILATLPLFVKFLYRHGSNLSLYRVQLPNELVSNKTIKLIRYVHILPIDGTDLAVDITDELLQETSTMFNLIGFRTKFTIKGITAFIKCTFIETLKLTGIKLDEELYQLMKPIADNVDVTNEWIIESALEPESFAEAEAANTGLFGTISLEVRKRVKY